MKLDKLQLAFAILTFLGIAKINAQDLKIGALGGANLASLSDGAFKKVNVQSAGLAFHLGGILEYNLANKIAVRSKLILSQQGDLDTKDVNSATVGSSDFNYKLTYVNIPLQVKFFSKPYIVVGPQVGFLVATTKGENDFGDVDSSFDYGLNAGIGYDFNQFFVEAGFYQGLQTVITLPNGAIPTGGTDDLSNTVFRLSIGYFF